SSTLDATRAELVPLFLGRETRLSCLVRISRDSPPRFYLTCLISFSDSRSRETTLFRQLRAGAARSGVARSAVTIPTGIIPRYLSFWELKTTQVSGEGWSP